MNATSWFRVDTANIILGTKEISENAQIHRQQFESKIFLIHPEWNSKTHINDIGLIRLPKMITFSGGHQ